MLQDEVEDDLIDEIIQNACTAKDCKITCHYVADENLTSEITNSLNDVN